MSGTWTKAGLLTGCAAGILSAMLPVAAAAQDAAPAPITMDRPQVVAPPQSFTVMAFDVVGVTKLSAAEIERAIYPYTGPGKGPADVEAARKAVQDAYTKAGYEATVVEVPPQPEAEFAAGLVRIAVSEAPVSEVRIAGSQHHSAVVLRRQLPSIKPGEPLNFKALQSDLEVANRFPDRQVIPSFDAGAKPGTIAVDLKVEDRFPLHVTAELNNDASPNTKSLRATASVRYTDLWSLGHTVSLGWTVAPERLSDSKAFFGSYSLPLMGSPWTFVLSGYKSNSDIAALGGTNVLGDGYQVGLQAIYRLPSDRDYHAVRLGVDYKDFKQDIGLRGETISNAPIKYLPLTLGYNFSAARDKESIDIGLSSTLGLRVIKRVTCFDPTLDPCPLEDQFTNREVDSTENFAHLNLDATYTAVLAHDIVGELRLSAQYADSHLVSNEQFAVGGLTTVRGYYQSEVVGDKGAFASAEIRAPSLATQLGKYFDEVRFFAFGDLGTVGVIDPLADAPSRYRIASIGGGLRVKMLQTFSGEIVVGVPLRSTTDTDRGDPRFTFQVKGEF